MNFISLINAILFFIGIIVVGGSITFGLYYLFHKIRLWYIIRKVPYEKLNEEKEYLKEKKQIAERRHLEESGRDNEFREYEKLRREYLQGKQGISRSNTILSRDGEDIKRELLSDESNKYIEKYTRSFNTADTEQPRNIKKIKLSKPDDF